MNSKIISGIYDLRTGINNFVDDELDNEFIFEKPFVSSRLLFDKEVTDKDKLVSSFLRIGSSIVNYEDGLFLAVIYHNKKLHILADNSGSKWNLYYTIKGKDFYYSSSLKELLLLSKIKRSINKKTSLQFIYNGFVGGKETLIDNVYKLDYLKEIVVSKNRIKIKNVKIESRKIDCDDLLKVLEQEIKQYTKDKFEINMPLSSGFDSNYILHVLKDCKRINAFTIGGEKGTNEIANVQEIVKEYSNINHKTKTINSEIFECLPDIVFKLDGSIYERGVFLQYALAKLAKENNVKYLICGECSDEHMNILYPYEFRRISKKSMRNNEFFNWMLQPYTFGNSIILKKSSLLLNSFGIKTYYPFASNNFAKVASLYSNENLDNKKAYIKLVKNRLTKSVSSLLKHQGGSTSLELLQTDEYTNLVDNCINNSVLISEILNQNINIHESSWHRKAERLLNQKGETTLSNFVYYVKQDIKEVFSKIGVYYYKKEELNNVFETKIKELYLILFYELIISGKYDESFHINSVDKKTTELIREYETINTVI